jgi:hypothetical protein
LSLRSDNDQDFHQADRWLEMEVKRGLREVLRAVAALEAEAHGLPAAILYSRCPAGEGANRRPAAGRLAGKDEAGTCQSAASIGVSGAVGREQPRFPASERAAA